MVSRVLVTRRKLEAEEGLREAYIVEATVLLAYGATFASIEAACKESLGGILTDEGTTQTSTTASRYRALHAVYVRHRSKKCWCAKHSRLQLVKKFELNSGGKV